MEDLRPATIALKEFTLLSAGQLIRNAFIDDANGFVFVPPAFRDALPPEVHAVPCVVGGRELLQLGVLVEDVEVVE